MAKICNKKRWSRLAPCRSSNWVESECLDCKRVSVLLPVQPGTRVAVTCKGLPHAAWSKLLSSAPPPLGLQEQNKPRSLSPSTHLSHSRCEVGFTPLRQTRSVCAFLGVIVTTRGWGDRQSLSVVPSHKAPSPSLLAKSARERCPAACLVPSSPCSVPRCPARPSCRSQGQRCNSARSCRRWGSSPGQEGRCWRRPSGFTAGSSKGD